MSIYDTLNDRQQEAVFHTEEPMEYPGDHIYEQGSRGDA